MDLFLFRLNLKEAGDLFVRRNVKGEGYSREDWIRDFFSANRTFVHFNNEFVFVPETRIAREDSRWLVFGWVARETEQSERTAPSEGLEPTLHHGWQAAFIAIDPTHHQDGQKVAFEHLDSIGKPSAVLASLVKAMNEIENAPFHTEEFSISDAGSFWEFAANHQEQIKSLTFDVAVPNMFDDATDFKNEMRSLSAGENVSNIKTTLESDTVLNHRTPRMREIIDYTEQGAGRLSAKSTDGEIYHSQEHAKHVIINVEHPSKSISEFLRQIGAFLDRIF